MFPITPAAVRPICLCVALLFLGKILAAKIPVEQFLRPPEFTDPQVSPDGKRVAFIAHQGWLGAIGVMDVATRKSVLIEAAKKESVSWIQWASNDRLVFRLAVQTDTGTSAGFYSLGGLYAVGADGSNPKELVPSVTRQAYRDRNRGKGINGLQIPVFLHALPKDPDHVLVSFYRLVPELEGGASYRLKRGDFTGVYELNIHTGARTQVEPSFGHVQWWGTDHDGKVRLAYSVEDDRADYFFRAAAGGPWEKYYSWRITDPEMDPLAIVPGEDKIYVATDRGRDTKAIYTFDPVRKELGPEVLASPDFDLDPANLDFDPVANRLMGIWYQGEKPVYHPLWPAQVLKQMELRQALPDLEPLVVSESDDGRMAVVMGYQDRRPPLYFLFDRTARKLSVIGSERPWLNTSDLSPMKPITFKARDGVTVRGYLTLPVAGEGGKPPLVVLPHGGPWARDNWGFDQEVQFLANRGYAVLQVNFRGSAGFGRNFTEAGYREWGAAMQDDITDAVKWVIAEGHVDADRIGIYGASYGGFAAMAGLCFTPELYRCGVNVCGVTDIRVHLDGLPREKKLLRSNMARLVGDVKEDSELLKRRSPQHNVDLIQVPVLLAYGQEDSIVDIKQGERFHRELKRNGKEVKYLVFPDEGHGFFRQENQVKFYGELEKFLERNLKSAPARKSRP